MQKSLMARARQRKRAKAKAERRAELPASALWSGSLSFGLVNVPVLLFPATRHPGVRLRLLSPGGSLLERRFYCPRDGKELGPDEMVKGYELEDGSYILVTDSELEALEPEKSLTIDLQAFVDIGEIAPTLFDRGYYLTPVEESTKAYRLLAQAMETADRAGIATFVMRDREYLVAIFARGGILCAETLRFRDELRDPATIGLSQTGPIPRNRVLAFERAIESMSAKALSLKELVDVDDRRLKAVIDKKHRAGKDLIHAEEWAEAGQSDRDGQVDLLETIRRSLRHTCQEHVADGESADPLRNGRHVKRRHEQPAAKRNGISPRRERSSSSRRA
jgi:DNA end-binding protein Ku